jgi:hypothetical protein
LITVTHSDTRPSSLERHRDAVVPICIVHPNWQEYKFSEIAYHASPQPSSSSSFFFPSAFGPSLLGAITVFFVADDPVVFDRPPTTGRADFVPEGLDRPLGSEPFAGFFAVDCAASQPAKSGSPLSSKGAPFPVWGLK